jgi:Zn-dependent protease with chaperone function
MKWLRCPHCATFLPSQVADDDISCGCPACGVVFSISADRAITRAKDGTTLPRVATAREKSEVPRDSFYPPGPRGVPAGLTLPSASHQLRAFLLLATLGLFFLLYVGLLIGSGCLIFWSFRFLGVCFAFPVAFLSLVVFLFLLKGFFKSEQRGKSLNVEITEEEQPRLFAFIRRVCEETGTRPPHRVFLSPEVNAAAFYENSMLGLIRPTPKNLLLGLGLVNVMTLSEFKAVLAHEFGHFSQRSMKLGMYVYTANRVLHGILTSRDWLEDTLLQFRALPGFPGSIGWGFWYFFFGLRQCMVGLFYGVNFFHSSLSREMEFHADLVAVSVTGSEPIVRSLARASFAEEALSFAAHELAVAAKHGLYSADLFIHHRDGMDYLRRKKKDPSLGEPPPLPADPMLAPEVFDPDDAPPSMWADHPSNYDREHNAKRHYVYCPLDDRSPWLLFDNRSDACERVTWRFYRIGLKAPRDTVLDEPEIVQKFIAEEHQALTYDPRYHGMYDARFINPGDLTELFHKGSCELPPATVLEQRHAALYAGTVAKWAAAYLRHREERDRMVEFRQKTGQDEDKEVVFRGKHYERREVGGLLEFIDEDLDKDKRKLAPFDAEILLVHYYMARQLDKTILDELRERYTFHMKLQAILGTLFHRYAAVESILAIASGEDEDEEAVEFYELFEALREARNGLVDCLEAAAKLPLPSLVHHEAGQLLRTWLWDRPPLSRFRWSRRWLTGKRIEKLVGQLAKVVDRGQRIHFKSLSGILALQEEISKQWLMRNTHHKGTKNLAQQAETNHRGTETQRLHREFGEE